jgi:protoheme IX farnesyltransferase
MSGASLAARAAARRSLHSELRAYWAVTDPRTVALLVFTGTAAGIAAGGLHQAVRLLVVSVALALSSMGARAVANYEDRDIDALMERTRHRPLPSGALAPERALVLGLALMALGMLAAAPFGPLVVVLMVLGLADNLLVYARLTKRTSPLNIVLGAPSGGAPALIGYVAIAGRIDLTAAAMAVFVILWTPIHIWSLAIRYREDYARAGVPMMPVVVGVSRSARYVGLTSLVLAVWTLAFVAASGGALWLPAAVAIALLAAVLVLASLVLVRRPSEVNAWRLFKLTAPYLAALFLLLATSGSLVGR